MIRITLIEIASFLLPFLLFFIWRWQSGSEEKLTATPALRLAFAGAALAVIAMIVMVVIDASSAGHEGDQYVPPRVVDGRVVPGHFVPRDGEDAATEPQEDPQ
jgi:hypothetical protein